MFHVCSLVRLLARASFLLLLTYSSPVLLVLRKTPRWLRKFLSSGQGTSLSHNCCLSQTLLLPLVCSPGQEGQQKSVRHPHPQNGLYYLFMLINIKMETPGAPRCNCMCLLYFYLLGWGLSEVSKEERPFHCFSKLRNNWSHNKSEKIEEEIEKTKFFL